VINKTRSALQYYKKSGNIKANTNSPGMGNKGGHQPLLGGCGLCQARRKILSACRPTRLPPLYSLLKRAGQQDRPITSRALIPWSSHLSSLISHLSLAVPARTKILLLRQ